MSAPVTKDHRKIANNLRWLVYDGLLLSRVAQAIADAEARGREAGIREAATIEFERARVCAHLSEVTVEVDSSAVVVTSGAAHCPSTGASFNNPHQLQDLIDALTKAKAALEAKR